MKCPSCRGNLTTMKVYGKEYHRCDTCVIYFSPELEEIEDITEYKNKIRRKALKKLLNITEVEDQE